MNKKEVKKVSFIDLSPNFNISYFLRLLEDYYSIVIVDKSEADYVFFGVWGDEHWFANDKSIKIFVTGENRTPDFNACDYAIGFENLDFGDRYLRYPLYYFYETAMKETELKHKNLDRNKLFDYKKRFCSVTVSNPNRGKLFYEAFDKINSYKIIDSGGGWHNNIGGRVNNKLEFDRVHKFTMAFEHVSYSGYITEKIIEAFAAQTIPIYWGDPNVVDVFNSKSFINVHDFSNTEDLVEMIKRIDSDDELYLSMLQEPAFVSEFYVLDNQKRILQSFLLNIFSQSLESCYRRTPYALSTQDIQRNMLKAYWKSKQKTVFGRFFRKRKRF